MKNPPLSRLNFDDFYLMQKGNVDAICGYLNTKYLNFVIKSCRLKPIELLYEWPTRSILRKKWVDEFGNSINVTTSKTLKVILNDLSIERDLVISTDLYENVSLKDLGLLSKLLYVCTGKFDDTEDEISILSYLGYDGFLRTRVLEGDSWHKNFSALYLGLKTLKEISYLTDIQDFIELDNLKLKTMLPFDTFNHFVTCWPPPPDFLTTISSNVSSQLI